MNIPGKIISKEISIDLGTIRRNINKHKNKLPFIGFIFNFTPRREDNSLETFSLWQGVYKRSLLFRHPWDISEKNRGSPEGGGG